MVYVVAHKSVEAWIRCDSQAHASRGERVWETEEEAALWRDKHAKSLSIFSVLADWDRDTVLVDKDSNARVLVGAYKLETISREERT